MSSWSNPEVFLNEDSKAFVHVRLTDGSGSRRLSLKDAQKLGYIAIESRRYGVCGEGSYAKRIKIMSSKVKIFISTDN